MIGAGSMAGAQRLGDVDAGLSFEIQQDSFLLRHFFVMDHDPRAERDAPG